MKEKFEIKHDIRDPGVDEHVLNLRLDGDVARDFFNVVRSEGDRQFVPNLALRLFLAQNEARIREQCALSRASAELIEEAAGGPTRESREMLEGAGRLERWLAGEPFDFEEEDD